MTSIVIDGDPKNRNVFNWNPRNFDHRILSETGLFNCFDACDAAWMHDGNPKSPHAELTSGKCSNGFFDCLRVLCHANLNEILALQLVRKLKSENLIDKVDWVIGSPYAAITFSYEVAKALKAIHAFAEKDPSDPKGKKMVWRRMKIPKSANVLQIEELITTSGTFKEDRRAVKKRKQEPVNFLSVIGVLVHRPPELPVAYIDGDEPLKVAALIEKEVWAVEPSECPLCKAGSKRLRPKAHWAELTGKA